MQNPRVILIDHTFLCCMNQDVWIPTVTTLSFLLFVFFFLEFIVLTVSSLFCCSCTGKHSVFSSSLLKTVLRCTHWNTLPGPSTPDAPLETLSLERCVDREMGTQLILDRLCSWLLMKMWLDRTWGTQLLVFSLNSFPSFQPGPIGWLFFFSWRSK